MLELNDFYESRTGIRPSDHEPTMTEAELQILCEIIAMGDDTDNEGTMP